MTFTVNLWKIVFLTSKAYAEHHPSALKGCRMYLGNYLVTDSCTCRLTQARRRMQPSLPVWLLWSRSRRQTVQSHYFISLTAFSRILLNSYPGQKQSHVHKKNKVRVYSKPWYSTCIISHCVWVFGHRATSVTPIHTKTYSRLDLMAFFKYFLLVSTAPWLKFIKPEALNTFRLLINVRLQSYKNKSVCNRAVRRLKKCI